MTADLILLSVACAGVAGGLASLAILLKRAAYGLFCSLLDHCASSMKI